VDERRHLRDVLGEDPEVRRHLSPPDLEHLLDPANYIGLAEALVDRALAARVEANVAKE
jgi:3-carboxy-cis,cis-muconate cycloisomerase